MIDASFAKIQMLGGWEAGKRGWFRIKVKGGRIKGEIRTKDIIVGGQITGNIYASNRAEFQQGANFQGELFCKQLIIEEGVFFEGMCKMSEKKDEQKVEEPKANQYD